MGDCLKTTRRGGKTALSDCLFLWPHPFDRDPVLIECGQDPRCLAVAPDGRRAALGTDDNRIERWDLKAAKLESTLTGHRNPGRMAVLAFSADGKRLASLSSRNADRRKGLRDGGDAEVVVWDGATGKAVARGQVHRSPCHLLVFFPDGRHLATAGRFDGRVRLWKVPGQ